MLKEDRFNMVGGIKRVTGGPGGEVFFLTGSEKTAVIDCGMAFSGTKLVENIKRELGDDGALDYIILSHTHYDHMGGLPYLKEAWPSAISIGAEYAKSIFEKPSALKRIRDLSKTAVETYQKSGEFHDLDWQLMDTEINYRDDVVKIDRAVKEGDRIDLGNRTIKVMETPGHTTCSLSFFMEEEKIFFPAETMGCLMPNGIMVMAILKGYQDTINSIEIGKNLKADFIISPHYGQVPEDIKPFYWDIARKTAETCKDFILKMHTSGATASEVFQGYKKEFWRDIDYNQQPLEAFEVNAVQTISTIIKELGKG